MEKYKRTCQEKKGIEEDMKGNNRKARRNIRKLKLQGNEKHKIRCLVCVLLLFRYGLKERQRNNEMGLGDAK